MKTSKLTSSHLIGIQAILFLIFLITCYYFNRFAADDYHFIGELNKQSFEAIYHHLYFKWHGRWTSNFLLLAFLQLKDIPYFLFLYGLFIFGGLYLSILRLLRIVNQLINLNLTPLKTYALLLIGILFFCTSSPNEVWFWYTSSIIYFWSTIAFFYALGSFLKPQKKWFDYIILILALVYIGGSNEPLALIIILLLCFSLFKKTQLLTSGISIFIITVSLSVNYLSPGTLHRDEITTGLNIKNLILYTGYGSIKYLFFQFHTTFLPAILFSIPFYHLGKKANYTQPTFQPLPQLFYSLLMIGLIIVFNQFVVIYALGCLPPERATITSSIAITILLVRYLFLLGNHHKLKNSSIKLILHCNVVGLFLFNILFFNIHFQFAKSVDDRISFIKERSKSNQTIEIAPLPNSGYLYHAELKVNPDFFVNQHLKKGMGIENDIILKKN